MNASRIILEAVTLRAWGKYEEAINLIENNIGLFDEAEIVPARLEAIYSALAAQMQETAIRHAAELAKYEPDLPVVKEVLKTK